MPVQAVLFPRIAWTPRRARAWLRAHDITPIKKVHTTEAYYRYRLRQPRPGKRYRTLKLENGVRYVMEY